MLPLLLAVTAAGVLLAPASPRVLSASPSAVAATGPQAPATPLSLLDQWFAAVLRHAPGRDDGDAHLVGSWPTADMVTVIAGIRSGRLADRTGLEALLLRGALLHTDIARFGSSPLGARSEVAMARDGVYEGMVSGAHWDYARAVIDRVSPNQASDPRVRLWYHATAAYLVSEARLGEALPHVSRAVRLLPTDRDILFAVGCMREALATPDRQAVMQANRRGAVVGGWRSVPSDTTEPGPDVGTASDELGRAEKAFRAALDADPAFADARLHLGWVLGLRGQPRAAAAELGRIPEPSDPVLRYLAALFLGRQHEALGDAAAARDDYGRAAILYPRAQSPRLAASAQARRSGDRAGSDAALAPLLTLPADAATRDDPWWSYGRGPRNADDLLREMYRVLGGGTK